MSHVVFLVGLPVFLVSAAIADVHSRTIPNALTGSMAVCGLVLSLVGYGNADFGPAIRAGAISLVIGVLLQLARLVGGGDVKLFTALAIWLGPSGATAAALATAIVGGVLALFFLRRPA